MIHVKYFSLILVALDELQAENVARPASFKIASTLNVIGNQNLNIKLQDPDDSILRPSLFRIVSKQAFIKSEHQCLQDPEDCILRLILFKIVSKLAFIE